MSELTVLRRAFEAVPEPADAQVIAARSRLLAEIAVGERPRIRRRPSVSLRLAAPVVVGAAAILAGVLALVLPRGGALTGDEIAAAASKVLVVPSGAIRHVIVKGPSPLTYEEWVASGRPYVIHVKTATSETEFSQCGRITYSPAANLVTVSTNHIRSNLLSRQRGDPGREYLFGAGEYLSPYRFGPIRYRGKTTFRGIPAYTLVRTDRKGLGGLVVYVVRRDNYYPLRIAVHVKGQPLLALVFSAFDEVSRTRETEHLLHIGAHPEAFLLRTSATNFYRVPGCARFGTFESLTGGRR